MTATIFNYPTDHPEYRDLLIQAAKAVTFLPSDDFYQLHVWSGQRAVWTSHRLDAKSILSLDTFTDFYPRPREKLRVTVSLTRRLTSLPTSAIVRLKGPVPHLVLKTGKVRVQIVGREQQYHSAIRNVRTIVGRASRSARPPKGRFPSSSNVRPSPENLFVSATVVVEQLDVSGNYFFGVTPTNRLYQSRTWTGTRTPNFGRLKKRQLPDNPHAVVIKLVTADSIHRFLPSIQNSYEYQRRSAPWSLDFPVPVDPGHLDLARNQALKKLIDRADLGIGGNLAQDFAQISQLTTLIGGTTKKLVSSINHLRKLNFPAAISALTAGRTRQRNSIRIGKPSVKKDLAENWLELQYGWKPLLMDINGVLNSLSTFQGGEPTVRRVTASSSASSSSSSSLNLSESNVGPSRGIANTRTKTQCKIQISFMLDSPLKSFLAQTGFTNPLNLAWEVLPFSFVVDWFLPIGPYLSALSAWDGLTFKGGCQTIFTRTWMQSTLDYEGPLVANPTAAFCVEHDRYCAEVVRLDRTPLASFPSPTFPQFKNPFASITHAANGIALLTASFRR